jgi:branched-chain amino acid aminotransferase
MNHISPLCICQGKIIQKAELKTDNHDQHDIIIYEVVRIIDSKILFEEDHYLRFLSSIENAGIKIPPIDPPVYDQINSLIRESKVAIGNIKYQVIYNKINHQSTFQAFFIPHAYPSDYQYSNGVSCITIIAERPTPNAKVQHTALRERTNALLKKTDTYEAIMVHSGGFITEGSRSNIFMISNNTVYTAPLADILPGITRKYIFEVCKNKNISICEKRITMEELMKMDAVFLTGTSPKVLPICKIDQTIFSTKNEIMRTIMTEFDQLIKKKLEK